MVVILCVCVCVLLRFRHRNIVDLLGFSDGGGSLCLIYSYMENRSLEDQLHNVTQMHTAQITPGFSQVFPGLGCFLGVIGGHCWVFSVLAFAIIAILLQYYRKKAGNTET